MPLSQRALLTAIYETDSPMANTFREGRQSEKQKLYGSTRLLDLDLSEVTLSERCRRELCTRQSCFPESRLDSLTVSRLCIYPLSVAAVQESRPRDS